MQFDFEGLPETSGKPRRTLILRYCIFLTVVIILISIRNLKMDIQEERYVKMILEWAPLAISIVLIVAEVCFGCDTINYLALLVTFRQVISLPNLSGTQ